MKGGSRGNRDPHPGQREDPRDPTSMKGGSRGNRDMMLAMLTATLVMRPQ